MEKNNNRININMRLKFQDGNELLQEDVNNCIDFAYDMAFGKGEHRVHRSGGTYSRKPGEIFANVFQGKIAEFAIYRFMEERGFQATYPDMMIAGEGIWDSFDIKCYNKKLSIKSTKFYGQLLLLETKDWNEDAEYIPNKEMGEDIYDAFVLIRIYPDIVEIMKKENMLYSIDIEKDKLKVLIVNEHWQYDIAGYINRNDFKKIIKNKNIIPKGAILNGKTVIDAENYYEKACDMRNVKSFIALMNYYKNCYEKK